MLNQDLLKNQARKNLEKLEMLRDEIHLNLHLAGMDAKDAWKRLEPKLLDARKFAEDVSDVSRKALEELVVSFEEFRAGLKRH